MGYKEVDKLKGKTSRLMLFGGFAIILIIILGVFGVMSGWIPLTGMPGITPPPAVPCDHSPVVIVDTPDLYGGTAVTSLNVYRTNLLTTWTNVSGAGNFSGNAGEEVEIVFGINGEDDDAEPYGCKASYTVPCLPTPRLSASTYCTDTDGNGVIDDALATDLTVTAIDPDDGNVITATDPVDLDIGQIKIVDVKWTGAYEEDFGNRFCEKNQNRGNILVVRINTTHMDGIKARATGGAEYPAGYVENINELLASSTGYTDYTFTVPTLKSNEDWNFQLLFDTDDTNDPSGNFSNITVYNYDVNYFIDNDVTPSEAKCSIMDEDGNEVGATAADQLVIYVTQD